MDKLTWFKFDILDWTLGTINRCPEKTRLKFIKLCCSYWGDNCFITQEDAEVVAGKKHLDILIDRKVVSLNEYGSISISFLDEQLQEIEIRKGERRRSGIIGNLKKHYPDIYEKYKSKQISFDEAVSVFKNNDNNLNNNELSHSDRTAKQQRPLSLAIDREIDRYIYVDKEGFNTYTIDNFLDNWMEISKANEKQSLTTNNIADFKVLASKYTKEDFHKALHRMFSQKVIIEACLNTPTHFLKEDNFVKYLNATTDNLYS